MPTSDKPAVPLTGNVRYEILNEEGVMLPPNVTTPRFGGVVDRITIDEKGLVLGIFITHGSWETPGDKEINDAR